MKRCDLLVEQGDARPDIGRLHPAAYEHDAVRLVQRPALCRKSAHLSTTQQELSAFLKAHEDCVDVSPQEWDELDDDERGVQHFMVDSEFGVGVMGAMFDAPMIVVSTPSHTMTYNSPSSSDPEIIPSLRSNPQNAFIRQVLDCLQYFVDHASKPFAIDLIHAFEGADFLAALRGEIPTLLDMADGQPFVEDLFRLGLESAGDLFALRRDIVYEHNVRAYGDEEFALLVPQGLRPTLDTDTDVMCSPRLFRKYGMRYKQKMLDRFGGGAVFIHTLGIHLVPAYGELHNLTQLRFCDDPKAPRAFDRRVDIRRQTFDIPLEIYCGFDEFSEALANHSLPGRGPVHRGWRIQRADGNDQCGSPGCQGIPR